MAVAKVEGQVRTGAVQQDDKQALEGGQGEMPQDEANRLSELGEKIFLDRYALKDVAKETLAVGDTVVVCVDLKSGQREIGTVRAIVYGGRGGIPAMFLAQRLYSLWLLNP